MAHKIAELMAASQRAKTEEKKRSAEQEAQALILDLWEHRSALPGNVDPNKRLAGAIEILEKIEGRQSYFFQHRDRGDKIEQDALKAHHLAQSLIVQLSLVKMLEDFEQVDADEHQLPLTEEEEDIRKKLSALLEVHVRRPVVVGQSDKPAEQKSDVEVLKENLASNAEEAIQALSSFREALKHDGKPAKSPSKTRRAKRSAKRATK